MTLTRTLVAALALDLRRRPPRPDRDGEPEAGPAAETELQAELESARLEMPTEVVIEAVARIGALFEDALDTGAISEIDLWDTAAAPVPGSAPAQVTTR